MSEMNEKTDREYKVSLVKEIMDFFVSEGKSEDDLIKLFDEFYDKDIDKLELLTPYYREKMRIKQKINNDQTN